MPKSREEILAYLDRKRRALDDPSHFGRFWNETEAGASIDFNIGADHDAEVQMVINAGGVTVFANMMIAEARAVHDALGRAIAEEQIT